MNKCWEDYVEISFNSNFARACKKRYARYYKIEIVGVDFATFKYKILKYQKIPFYNENLSVQKNQSNTKYEINGAGVVGLIDVLFNNGAQFIYVNNKYGNEWTHDKDKILWNSSKNGTLTFIGNLKSRCPGFHWTSI